MPLLCGKWYLRTGNYLGTASLRCSAIRQAPRFPSYGREAEGFGFGLSRRFGETDRAGRARRRGDLPVLETLHL